MTNIEEFTLFNGNIYKLIIIKRGGRNVYTIKRNTLTMYESENKKEAQKEFSRIRELLRKDWQVVCEK